MPHDPDYYSAIGRQGGRAVVERYGRAYLRTLAARGGTTVSARYGAEYYRAIGRLGGEILRDSRGPDYYRRLGLRSQAARRAAATPAVETAEGPA